MLHNGFVVLAFRQRMPKFELTKTSDLLVFEIHHLLIELMTCGCALVDDKVIVRRIMKPVMSALVVLYQQVVVTNGSLWIHLIKNQGKNEIQLFR
ncbi:hypothetical protein XMV209_000023 [Aliiroseovarius sp. xm-v-209]|nr:hypothetical protein [Aliiroseovarius sp. xm-m-314]NRP78435.1 hypothetical protein [Aliiroseovarius sp. xm-v-209]